MADGEGGGPGARGAADGHRPGHPSCHALYRYWDRLRAGRAAPARRDIEPADISAVLRDTFILEVSDAGTMPYRLAGTRLCAIVGAELRGTDWLAHWGDADLVAIATLVASVARDAAGGLILATGRFAEGRTARFETLILPLKHTGPHFSRLIGATGALDQPYWLTSRPLERFELEDVHLIWPDERPYFLRAGADRAAVFDRAMPRRMIRHLAIYDGGRSDG